MTPEQIRRLQQEIASQQQKETHPEGEHLNGHTLPDFILEPEKHDPVITGLHQQLRQVRSANRRMRELMDLYQEIERSLSTLLPALEIQVKGWNTEIQNLRQNAEDTDHAYVSIVTQLENKLSELRQAQQAEAPSGQKEAPLSNPFTDLNIHEP
jgi:hypothetical protein